MSQPIVQVDSFTGTPFRGNPAAVCVMPGPREVDWMQAVAAEMNLSETAFLYPIDNGFNLRWFTPAIEVDLCGHATLAAAHVLWSEGHVERGRPIRFYTKSGLLVITRQGDLISMDFPATTIKPARLPEGLLEALGVAAVFAGRDRHENYLVEVANEAAVLDCRPNYTELARLTRHGVIITSVGRGEFDFFSRFFAPAIGINEDPVTGSAHCALGPYWAEKLGKETVVGYQASRRGGIVRVSVRGSRVLLAGEAVTVLRGVLLWSDSSDARVAFQPGPHPPG